jgi:hypothetical protein
MLKKLAFKILIAQITSTIISFKVLFDQLLLLIASLISG